MDICLHLGVDVFPPRRDLRQRDVPVAVAALDLLTDTVVGGLLHHGVVTEEGDDVVLVAVGRVRLSK